MAITINLDKLASQEIVFERGMIREVITVHDVTDWWDSTFDGAPVSLGEAAKRIVNADGFPKHGDRLLDDGGGDVMPNRPLYLIDMDVKLKDSNRAQLESRYEYLGATVDGWTEVDGSLNQITTHFDRFGEPIVLSRADQNGTRVDIQGAEVSVQNPRRRATKTYGRFLEPGETASSLIGSYLGKVNLLPYLGGAPGTWLVTNMLVKTVVEPLDATPALVQITVEIEHFAVKVPKSDGSLEEVSGHLQAVFWREPTTLMIGAEILRDMDDDNAPSWKLVDWHETASFAVEFGS